MANGRRDSLKEAGALVRLLLGAAIALGFSIAGWLARTWDPASPRVQAALAVVIALAFGAGLLLEAARAVARAMED